MLNKIKTLQIELAKLFNVVPGFFNQKEKINRLLEELKISVENLETKT